MMSIIPLIVILQSNFRKQKYKKKYQKMTKNITILQKFIRKKILSKDFILSKKTFKKMKTQK